MFYPQFTVTTNTRKIKVFASNKFRAQNIANERLNEGETIVQVERTKPKSK